jgi:Glycosyltransferase family 87
VTAAWAKVRSMEVPKSAHPAPPAGNPAGLLRRPWFFPFFAGIATLALLSLGGHGPFRHAFYPNFMSDFAPLYTQTRAWINGSDPYSQAAQLAFWPKQIYEGQATSTQYLTRRAGLPTPYPIFTFVAALPLALLPWPLAGSVLLVLDFGLLFVVIKVFLRFFGPEGWQPWAWFATALALDPIYAGMLSNNVGVLAGECALLGWTLTEIAPGAFSAILLAFAAALKPQLAVCFLLCVLLRRRWRVAGQAMAFLALATVIALARLSWTHVGWLSNYLQDGAAFFHAGGINDFRRQNLYRFDLINLHVIFYPLFQSAKGAQFVALSLWALLFALWVKYSLKLQQSQTLLSVGCLCVIWLLPFYHRYYDATLLLLPLCWYVAQFRLERLSHKLSLLPWLPFLIPFAMPWRVWLARGAAEDRWLDAFVRPAANWCLLLIAIVMLWKLRRARRLEDNFVVSARPCLSR